MRQLATLLQVCVIVLTPMEALTPRSCAELASTFVRCPRKRTSDFASSLAPFSFPFLHTSPEHELPPVRQTLYTAYRDFSSQYLGSKTQACGPEQSQRERG